MAGRAKKPAAVQPNAMPAGTPLPGQHSGRAEAGRFFIFYFSVIRDK
jgi:hypothetical protein